MSKSIEEQIKSYCAYQERSHQEVRNKLLSLGLRHEALEDCILMLIEQDYLNELRYAKAIAGGKFRINKWGKNKIIQSLRLQQISAFCMKEALKEINEKEYLKTLENLFEKKWEQLQKEKNIKNKKAKLLLYLNQKGYEHNLIMDLLNKK